MIFVHGSTQEASEWRHGNFDSMKIPTKIHIFIIPFMKSIWTKCDDANAWFFSFLCVDVANGIACDML